MPETGPFNFASPTQPDSAYIRAMFDRMARRYDTFAALTSFGQGHRWRAQALATIGPGMRVLDLGCGTGDLALQAAARVGERGEVVGLDFSTQMLEIARQKYCTLRRPGWGALTLRCARAEELPLEGPRFDAVVSGFVMRNLYEHIDRILEGVRDSLRPGGHVRFVDITEPQHPLLRALFRSYMLTAVGVYGAVLFGNDYPIPYLPDSAGRFLKADEFPAKLTRTGFIDVAAQPFLFGSVTLYHARTPSSQRPRACNSNRQGHRASSV